MDNQILIDMALFKKTRKSLNCTPKTMKVIGENQENILCVWKGKEMIIKKGAETRCWCSKTGMPLNAKHIASCYRNVIADIDALLTWW